MEEELAKLRHENFNLKLRIHLLEEHQGLTAARPGDAENVIRFEEVVSLPVQLLHSVLFTHQDKS